MSLKFDFKIISTTTTHEVRFSQKSMYFSKKPRHLHIYTVLGPCLLNFLVRTRPGPCPVLAGPCPVPAGPCSKSGLKDIG